MKTKSSLFLSSLFGAGIALVTYTTLIPQNKTQIIIKDSTSNGSPIPSNDIKMVNYGFNQESITNFVDASEKSLDAVVHIKTKITLGQINDPVYRFFYGDRIIEQNASGSGVIITENGYIVTNNHVIADANSIEVTLNNNETYSAKLIGKDPSTDLALIKIEAKNLNPLMFANSDEVQVGEWALAVGNPFNLTSTVTAGIISAKARNINILHSDYKNEVFPIESFIQTDAAVNPGNSGGALVNSKGELIGINAAIASKTGSYSGYSFAIPSNLVKKVTADLIKYGSVQRGFIGINLKEIDSKVFQEFQLPNLDGVLVSGLAPNGGGFEAGIEKGDVILSIDDVKVNNIPSLQEQVGRFSPGDKVPVTIRRGNETLIKMVELKKIQ
ncbi:MAG: trypsin-like peptidase domain-containing protein [Flavobacteriales bacterium]|nr:trypsin-like peptidase domain-containing protein [Flavobacteriales bacterium]